MRVLLQVPQQVVQHRTVQRMNDRYCGWRDGGPHEPARPDVAVYDVIRLKSLDCESQQMLLVELVAGGALLVDQRAHRATHHGNELSRYRGVAARHERELAASVGLGVDRDGPAATRSRLARRAKSDTTAGRVAAPSWTRSRCERLAGRIRRRPIPAHDTAGVPGDDRKRRHLSLNDRPGADDCATTDTRAAKDHRTCANPDVVADLDVTGYRAIDGLRGWWPRRPSRSARSRQRSRGHWSKRSGQPAHKSRRR
jgi:hypothetical protein